MRARALVTGSSGFLGCHFSDQLLERGWIVKSCDPLDPLGYGDALELFVHTLDRYDLVVHCAARAPHRAAIDGQPGSLVYNQLLDAALFEWALRTEQKRLLYISSCAVMDDQPDAYGLLKLAGERMADQARACGVEVYVVRPYSGYGEDQSTDFPFGAFTARARRRDDPFTMWGDGLQVRDWIHVDDIVAGALAVVDSGMQLPVPLCTGVGTSMAELAGMFAAAAGYSPDLELWLDKPAGAASRIGDPTLMRKVYTPVVSLADGVKRAITREVSP